jgi:hypothetical protein
LVGLGSSDEGKKGKKKNNAKSLHRFTKNANRRS